MSVTSHGEETTTSIQVGLHEECMRMTVWCVHLAHECVWLCFSFLSTAHVSTLISCPSRVSMETGESQRECVCVWVAEVVHPHGPKSGGTSSGMGSDRWSRGARCTATSSVGSAWLECRLCEPLGPRNLAPKLSPPHTPPKNTNSRQCLVRCCLSIASRLKRSEVRLMGWPHGSKRSSC